jgi:4-amino-4-deoxy-L-arabinose transferase-like glycosyltransferase
LSCGRRSSCKAGRGGLLAILALAACLNIYRLGAGSLWDQDETRYAEIAAEIVQTGDPITLHANGDPWYVHPPFYMWLVAATGRVMGFTEFSVRFWSALFSLVGVYATFLLGRAFFGERTGVAAAAVLAVTLQYLIQSRLAVFDTVLVAWMLLAFYAFYQGYRRGSRGDYMRFFLFAGLATLTKGLVGIVLPGLIIAGFVTLRGAWGRWREVPWTAGLVLYTTVGLSWYAVETVLHGRPFAASALGYYTFGRFFGIVENQANPWWLYVPTLALGGFPWSVFWPAAAAWHLRRARPDDGSLLVLLACGGTFLFYTAAATKLPNYILPVYPFAAIGVAALWVPAIEQRQINRTLGVPLGSLVVLMGVLFMAVGWYLGSRYPEAYRAHAEALLLPAAAIALGVGTALTLAVRGHAFGTFVALGATMAVIWIGVLTWAVPAVEVRKPMKSLALAIKGALRPDDRIVAFGSDVPQSLVFYTGHRVERAERPQDLRAFVCEPGRVFVVLNTANLAAFGKTLPRPLVPFAARSDVRVLVKPAAEACGAAGTRTERGRHERAIDVYDPTLLGGSIARIREPPLR